MNEAVVYFDGLCGLCDRFVRFVLVRDRRRRYRFAPLQGETARARLPTPPDPGALDTVVLEVAGRFRTRSDAALAILSGLGGPWRLAAALRVIPPPLRDAFYDFVARHRLGWLGRREACRLPAPHERDRFLP